MSDAGGGNLDEMSEGEWNALCSEEDVLLQQGMATLNEASQRQHEHQEAMDADVLDIHDEVESVASSFEVCRHPRDPTYAVGEDNFQETGYMPESEMTKSCIGIKHPRSQSVLFAL